MTMSEEEKEIEVAADAMRGASSLLDAVSENLHEAAIATCKADRPAGDRARCYYAMRSRLSEISGELSVMQFALAGAKAVAAAERETPCRG